MRRLFFPFEVFTFLDVEVMKAKGLVTTGHDLFLLRLGEVLFKSELANTMNQEFPELQHNIIFKRGETHQIKSCGIHVMCK